MTFPRLIAFLLCLLLASAGVSSAVAAVNPFTGAGDGAAVEQAPVPAPDQADEEQDSFSDGGVFSAIAAWQRELRAALSAQVRGLTHKASTTGLALFLALAFGYGALHAAGPGHGKAVAVSFVVGRGEGPGRAALLGAIMGTTHAASAVALVLTLRFVLERSLMAGFSDYGLWVERVSYALVCGIALWMLWQALRGEDAEDASQCAGSGRGLVATGLCAGLVPCPGAAIVLLFSLALGAMGIGLAAVAAMGAGMAATIAGAGVLAALFRSTIAALGSSRPERAAFVRRVLAVCGALVVLAFGATLLVGTFSH